MRAKKNLAGAALASLFYISSGEANIPMHCLSSTSEDAGVVVTSSPELYAEQKLALLDGKSNSVPSTLLTSTVTLGS